MYVQFFGLLSVHVQFGVMVHFQFIDDLVSTFDLNIQGSLYYTLLVIVIV